MVAAINELFKARIGATDIGEKADCRGTSKVEAVI